MTFELYHLLLFVIVFIMGIISDRMYHHQAYKTMKEQLSYYIMTAKALNDRMKKVIGDMEDKK